MQRERGIIRFVAEHPQVLLAVGVVVALGFWLNPRLEKLLAAHEAREDEQNFIRARHGPATARLSRLENGVVRPRNGVPNARFLEAMREDAETKMNKKLRGK